jgi:hypothetical protein
MYIIFSFGGTLISEQRVKEEKGGVRWVEFRGRV